MADTSAERVARHRAQKKSEEKLVREAEQGAAIVSAEMAQFAGRAEGSPDPAVREQAAAERRERAWAYARWRSRA